MAHAVLDAEYEKFRAKHDKAKEAAKRGAGKRSHQGCISHFRYKMNEAQAAKEKAPDLRRIVSLVRDQ